MERAGFAIPRKSGNGYYDRFRNRLMIPIASESGNTIAFGGRILGEGEPKYLNSPESPVYNKSAVLYGFHGAKDAIRREGTAILMEGYMDCLQAYQAGVRNAVACCGTSLTADHARLIKRYTDTIILNFDPDEAGLRAARRSVDLLLETGFDTRVLTLPDGLDPDGFLRARGAERYREELAEATSFVDFLIREASKRYDVSTPRGKAEFLGDVLPVLGKIPNRVERIGYVGPSRSTLASRTEPSSMSYGVTSRAEPSGSSFPRERYRRPVRSSWRSGSSFDGFSRVPRAWRSWDEIEDEDLDGLRTAPILRMMKQNERRDG